MHDAKMRVRSDRFEEHKKSMEEYGMSGMESIPVDLYGKRITIKKDDKNNLQNIGEDIKEFYDLEGDLGLSE